MKFGSPAIYIVLSILMPTCAVAQQPKHDSLAGTSPLTMQGDIAAQLVEGVDRFLLREMELSIDGREKHFKRDFSSPQAYLDALQPNRDRLAHILGVREERQTFSALEFVATTTHSHLLCEAQGFKVYAVRWPVIGNMHGEGLWLVPEGRPLANVIAIPDADHPPELICGLKEGLPEQCQFARQLAAAGCQVLIPTLINREYKERNGRAKMTNREYLYRSAYVLGQHLMGYEVQKVLAAADWFERVSDGTPLGVIGNGEGGMLALYAGALDTRFAAVGVSGYFGTRQTIWQQPISRNVFGLLEQFGDAELASMITPRTLVVDGNGAPTLELPSEGGAPARLDSPSNAVVASELERLSRIIQPLGGAELTHISIKGQSTASVHPEATAAFWTQLTQRPRQKFSLQMGAIENRPLQLFTDERHSRQFREIEEVNQRMLAESVSVRRGFMNLGSDLADKRDGVYALDTSSLAGYAKNIKPYRDYFRNEIIGHFDHPLADFNARTRILYNTPKWTGYEVVLDVFPDVIAYGILCLPKDLKPEEKRPVVVCQHGLEGRAQDTIKGDHWAYHDFAAHLAERGYVVFAPQNLYIGQDKFRTLQRKANPLKKTLFSVMVPQHQQIVNWLKTQPNVDAQRIAFYGLSYGGKSAMRIPPLVPDYCLSICSADFNDWVDKTATTRESYSYVWTNEYEIFEFDLGTKFNYAEMAALIAPRPFMVERGHLDRVGTDERVAAEFAKVRFLYGPRLGIPERCEIEWFNGPHTINGQGTYRFLDRHLRFETKR